MEKKEVLKTAATWVVGIGVNSIISNAVASTTVKEGNKLTKACTWISVMVLTGIVADAAIKYTESKLDEVINFVKEGIVEIKERME